MNPISDIESDKNASPFIKRVIIVAIVALLGILGLFARAYFLQVVQYDDFQGRAESNRTAIVPIVPYRGDIIDRNGVLLATNYSAYTLEISPSKVTDLEGTIDELSKIIEIKPIDRRRFQRLREESGRYDSIILRSQLTEEDVARFAAQSYRFPGVQVAARMFRTYPMGKVASHVIGYIGRINQQEKERIDNSDDQGNYRGTVYIGKQGIEEEYEKELHGTTGVEQLEKSSAGHLIRLLDTKPAHPGNTIKLSLDIKLQRMIEDIFGHRRGALVAIDPNNGEVLAMVSMPTYDPNLFVDGIDQETWKSLNESIDRPLFNRALKGTYPPASTYKPYMALAALETGTRTPETIIHDNGAWVLGNHRYRSSTRAMGAVDLRRAIEHSNNVYFYSLAYEMGVDKINDFMDRFGFGRPTGIDLKGESRGVLPSKEWKRRAFKNPRYKTWIPGDTVSLGIGQGYNSFTLVQMAHALATLANGGLDYRPHIGKEVIDLLTHTETPLYKTNPKNLGFKPQNIKAVHEGMERVMVTGSGRASFKNAPYRSAGKTGTAQAVSIGQNQRYNAAALEERKRDHSLFIAFAPANKPKIAVALIVENAGWGASSAAPIARRVLDYWVEGIYPSEADIAAIRSGARVSEPIGTPRRVQDIPLPQAALSSKYIKETPPELNPEPEQNQKETIKPIPLRRSAPSSSIAYP